MQRSQRCFYNHALEYAVQRANDLDQPLLVVFCLTPVFPEANRRHYAFMLQGLRETGARLEERGIKMMALRGSPERCIPGVAENASLVVTDRGYLRLLRMWREAVAGALSCQMVQVEGDVVVPVQEASKKEEYIAATIRPKIQGLIEEYLHPLEIRTLRQESLSLHVGGVDVPQSLDSKQLRDVNDEVGEVDWIKGGESEASRLLDEFVQHRLDDFADFRNDPSRDCLSNMSPYLHFGQISPLYIVLKVMSTPSRGKDVFLEELIVRRELAANFVFYNHSYDSFACLPDWAKVSLYEHAQDRREYCYSLEEMESAATHDPYWNAAQTEMVHRKKMHGYMRMYWGKKILEWSPLPEEGYRRALYLNNKYSLDGRDPGGYAGIAWCFGKHDRAWAERPVFGKVWYMNQRGLKRKFDVDAYAERVDKLVR
jgi:deoxyribodipyrimidine photo-lyase